VGSNDNYILYFILLKIGLCYADRLTKLDLPSLELRRLQLDLIYCYKIVFALVVNKRPRPRPRNKPCSKRVIWRHFWSIQLYSQPASSEMFENWRRAAYHVGTRRRHYFHAILYKKAYKATEMNWTELNCSDIISVQFILFIYYMVYTHVKSFTIVKNRKFCRLAGLHSLNTTELNWDLSIVQFS